MSNIHEVPPDITFDKFPVIDRRSYSEHLTNFLNSKAEGGYVLNLNAEWGAGKTTFLQCWYNELKKDHPVVYFDAWKSDFTHDAMLALLEAFHSQLMNALTENKALLKKVMEGGAHFIKNTSWKLALGFIKRQGGMDADDSLFSDISEELNELGIDASDLTDSLKETFTSMTEQKRKVEGVHDFKKTLVELSKAYLEVHSDKKGPIYVLIDELDRCRPTYAIEVIESVKHFFNTENFVFVLATDTEQLQHSIRAVYGEGFDSASYLSRFFDRTAVLPAPSIKQYIQTHLTEIVQSFPEQEFQFDTLLENIFVWHGMSSLREINKVLNDVEVFMSANGSYKVLCIVILSILKHKYPATYKRYCEKKINPYYRESQISPFDANVHLAQTLTVPAFAITYKTNISISTMLHHMLGGISDDEHHNYNFFRYESADTDTKVKETVYALLHLYKIRRAMTIHPSFNYLSVLNFAGHLSE
ncbi:KAP P-loop domain-containing protein [Vibrio phage VD1]|nr:KAP P-loop domain-containing protein [Vibrio phage VD1]